MVKHAKKQKKWTWKKPPGKPKRPLSAYNLFYRDVRQQLLKSKGPGRRGERTPTKGNPALGFKSLTKAVALRWKTISPQEKHPYELQAHKNLDEYYKAVDMWERSNSAALQKCEPLPIPLVVQVNKPENKTLEGVPQGSRLSNGLEDVFKQVGVREKWCVSKQRCNSPDWADKKPAAGLCLLQSSPTSVAHETQALSVGEGPNMLDAPFDPCSSAFGLYSYDVEEDQELSDVSVI